jgi:DNA-binding transcriptional LysR family regulator
LSQALKKIEDDFGVRLFVRTTSRIRHLSDSNTS